jgi:2-methylcitrate dehydratase PrpD
MTATRAKLPSSGGEPAASVLAEFATALRFETLPTSVVAAVRHCILDTVGVCLGGADWEPSRIGLAYAGDLGSHGRSVILDGSGGTTNPPGAAFLNGLLSHAIEYDCLRKPGAGVHGAPVVAAALAVAQHLGRSGTDLIAAVAAGIEVMFRIGSATHHSCETRGFHAPGLTGPFGAAIAAGHLLRLDPAQMTRALGIAGSLASGLLEFARSGDGSMVKKLHLGRAAEAGVVAAMLGARGFSGPASVLDGGFGFLSVFCEQSEPSALTAGLGTDFEAEKLCFKRFPCHITAHAPVEAMLALKAEYTIAPGDVRQIRIVASQKATTLHNIPNPTDMGLAQYSIPFCVAVALARNPSDPTNFFGPALGDPVLSQTARNVLMRAADLKAKRDPWAASLEIELLDGRVLGADIDEFPGMPTRPFDHSMRRDKFMKLAPWKLGVEAATMFLRLEALEEEVGLGWVGCPASSID